MIKREHNGFTLIELLLAIMLFSLVAAGVYRIFWSGIELSRRADRQNSAYREVLWALDAMAAELEQAVPYHFENSYPDHGAFHGTDNTLRFIVPGDGGLKVVSYALVPASESHIHQIQVGATYAKNVALTLTNTAKESYDLQREETGLADYLAGHVSDEDIKEVVATGIARDGFKVMYGYSSGLADPSGLIQAGTWDYPSEVPSRIDLALNVNLGTGDDATVEIVKKIFIPTGTVKARVVP